MREGAEILQMFKFAIHHSFRWVSGIRTDIEFTPSLTVRVDVFLVASFSISNWHRANTSVLAAKLWLEETNTDMGVHDHPATTERSTG